MAEAFNSNNINELEIMLYKVNAEKIEKEPSDGTFTVKREDDYEILNLKERNFSLRFNTKVFLDPEALFCISLEYRLKYELSHKVDEKFITENIEKILGPLGGEVSYVTSTLTKFLTNNYVIMPPIIKLE